MITRIGGAALAVLTAAALAGCTAEQTEEGELPAIEAEGGELPEYEVDAADVDVRTDTTALEVPTGVEVTPPDTSAP